MERESITPVQLKDCRRQRRKIRLSRTAPANMHISGDENRNPRVIIDRKAVKSGPETQEERNKMLNLSGKKSVFLQLSGKGKEMSNYYDIEPYKKKELPNPKAKTLMDVMIGLNAFSYLPRQRRNSSEMSEHCREDSRMSVDQDSTEDTHEHIATSFMMQWKSKVASRKFSIINKLENQPFQCQSNIQRCDSFTLSSVPEDMSMLNQSRDSRKSKWTLHHQMKQHTLPAIDDEEERKLQFLEWVNEQKAKLRAEKESVFVKCVQNTQAHRRQSFTCWLQKRHDLDKHDDESDEEDDGVTDGLRELIDGNDDDDDKPATLGDLMKTLLKIKTRFKDPLDSRVRRFNKEIDKIKKRDDAVRNKEMSSSQKRRWKMLLAGIDTTLVESSEDEEGYN